MTTTTDYRLPTTYYRLPTTDYLLPTTDYRLPLHGQVSLLLSDGDQSRRNRLFLLHDGVKVSGFAMAEHNTAGRYAQSQM